jgi:hypothetical protein
MPYAEETSEPVERSRAEIEELLRKYGADQFASGWSGKRAVVQFLAEGRTIRFVLPLPNPTDTQFTQHPRYTYKYRSTEAAKNAYEQQVQRRWRALALVIKAKLEAVETGIATFENEFMPHVIMPDGKTVAEHVQPWIAQAYESRAVGALPGW